MAGFLFLQSEGLTNHCLAVGDDAPPYRLQSLIFGRGHGGDFAELGRLVKAGTRGRPGPAAVVVRGFHSTNGHGW
jgi:hypothetical protein